MTPLKLPVSDAIILASLAVINRTIKNGSAWLSLAQLGSAWLSMAFLC